MNNGPKNTQQITRLSNIDRDVFDVMIKSSEAVAITQERILGADFASNDDFYFRTLRN
ncbi:MAG: hypothetical protein ACJAYF_000068 [Arenicella sp.]|jgi:hypothetical protein